MAYFPPGERQPKEIAPGINIRTFWGEKMLISVVDLAEGAVLPRHSHPHEQVGIVLAGELELTVENETRLLRAGEVYVIPGGVEHSARTGPGSKVADVFSPVREEYKY